MINIPESVQGEQKDAALKANIAVNGILQPILVATDNAREEALGGDQLAETPEGSNRWIGRMLGVSHPFVGFVRAEVDSTGNGFQLDRSDQCISPSLFHETPEHANRVIAKMLGVSHPTVSSVRSDLTSVGNLFQQERRVGADEKAYKASLSAVTWKQLPKLVSWINGASKVIGIDREATFLRTARERISNG